MTTWIIVFFAIFFSLLIWASYKSYKKDRSSDDFMLAGSSIGAVLGFLTFAAALFSAFTFMGMPDFFRVHGVGAWLFLAFSDGFMVFFLLWFAYKLRKTAKRIGYKGISGMVAEAYKNKWAGYLLFLSSFIFLVPYVSIQIRGISIFLDASFPSLVPSWVWAVGTVVIMLVYAQIGGLKAIVFSDAIQALLLLVVIWIIGTVCLQKAGGLGTMFATIKETNPDLLSLPGPKGLFSIQFLIASALSIILIPVSQPQFTTRLVVMKDLPAVHKMAYAVGIFAILVIIPTAFIGFYGAIKYPDANTSDFLTSALLSDQMAPVAALAVVGLFAACLSTTNAQIFALGTEIRSLLKGEDKKVMNITRISLLVFTIVVLVFSTLMGNELALLAKVSFTGTSMIAPVVFGAIWFKKPPLSFIVISALALLIYIGSVLSIVPNHLGDWRLDILLYAFLTIACSIIYFTHKKTEATHAN